MKDMMTRMTMNGMIGYGLKKWKPSQGFRFISVVLPDVQVV